MLNSIGNGRCSRALDSSAEVVCQAEGGFPGNQTTISYFNVIITSLLQVMTSMMSLLIHINEIITTNITSSLCFIEPVITNLLHYYYLSLSNYGPIITLIMTSFLPSITRPTMGNKGPSINDLSNLGMLAMPGLCAKFAVRSEISH